MSERATPSRTRIFVRVVRRALLDHLVNQTEGLRLLARHEIVPLHALLDLVHRAAGVLDVDLVQPLAGPDDLAGVDLDVGGLALEAAGRLVDHHLGIRQAVALAGGRSEEHTSELQSLMRISYAVFCLKKKKPN